MAASAVVVAREGKPVGVLTRSDLLEFLAHRVVATLRDMPVDRLESLLRDAFPDAAELRVEDRTGGGDHFQVTVESPRFDGLPLLEQHRLVNDALAEPLRDGTIHELRIKTRGTT